MDFPKHSTNLKILRKYQLNRGVSFALAKQLKGNISGLPVVGHEIFQSHCKAFLYTVPDQSLKLIEQTIPWPKERISVHTDDSFKSFPPVSIVCSLDAISNLFWSFNTIRNNGLDIKHSLQKIFDDLILSFLARLLDLLHLFLCVLVCIFFGLLVSAGML